MHVISIYVAEDDVYRCPAGERLTYRFTTTPIFLFWLVSNSKSSRH
jgi:hypothetical protein